MKQKILRILFVVFIFSSLLLCSCVTKSSQNNSKVLMVVPDTDYNEHEFIIPAEFLKSNGYQIIIANINGVSSSSLQGSEVNADLSLDEVNPEDYLGVIFVGGVGASIFWENDDAISLARQFYEAGKPTGALCLAPVVFAKAGILDGKKATGWSSVGSMLEAGGADFTSSKNEISGNIITGMGCGFESDSSNSVGEFSQEFLNLLKNEPTLESSSNEKTNLEWWNTETPESQQIDKARLDTALNNAEEYPELRSLLIIRNGYLVSENYYANADADRLHLVHSAAKSLTGILTGIAIEQDYIQSVEDPISKYLNTHLDIWPAEKEQIKIKHLLSMTNGLEWSDEFYDEFFESADPAGVALSKPMAEVPGEKFNYDVSAYLLSVIIQDATGMSAYDFAEKNIFIPYDFGEVIWGSLGEYTMGFGDLYIRPQDMAKLGLLMIQEGLYNNEQLINKAWIKDAVIPQVKTGNGLPSVDTVGDISEINYGYMLWLGWKDEVAFYWAGGLGGQRIICVPEKNLVVVMTAYVPPLSEMDAEDWQKAEEQDVALLSFFVNDILPAIQ